MRRLRVRRSRQTVLIALTLVSMAVLMGCTSAPRTETLHGIVVDVQAASFSQVSGFTLRADDGTDHTLIVEGDIGFTPSHLRQHMLLAERVAVTIKEDDGLRIATHVEDAPTS